MEVTLRINEGTPRTVLVDKPEFVIGRAADCDLTLASCLVSRRHCALTIRDDGVYVRDLESSNGTGLNNMVLVGRKRLHAGDRLWVAATPIEVHIRRDQPVATQVAGFIRKMRHPIPAMTNPQPMPGNVLTN